MKKRTRRHTAKKRISGDKTLKSFLILYLSSSYYLISVHEE